MVRAILLSASTAAATEPTGLLQATVGVQSHLAVGADKASSMKKMQKEWEAAAKAGESIDDASLETVYDSMKLILEETVKVKTDIDAELVRAAKDVTDEFDDTYTEHDNALMAGEAGGQWGGVCIDLESHNTCRDAEKTSCVDRDTECNEMSDVQERCLADNPLCNCDDDNNSAETMKECLEKAQEWHNNFHNAADFLLSNDFGSTRANLDHEEKDCTDGNTECDDKKESCDSKQMKAQENFCEFDQQCDGQCTGYKSAFASALSTYRSIVALQVADASDQKDEDSFEQRNKEVCFAAKKVVCYINVIASGHKNDNADFTGKTYDLDGFSGEYTFDSCQSYEPDCSSLDVTEPTEPVRQECSLFKCSAKIAAGIPENGNWLQDYYQAADNTLDCSYNIDFYLPTSSKWASDSEQPEAMHSCR